jgi:DNA-binding XRE family transcriptional regulator
MPITVDYLEELRMAYIFESEAFAKALREYREYKKVTQKGLADQLEIARPTINLLENQKTKPTREQLEKICTQIKQPIEAFFYQAQTEPLLYMMGSLNDHEDQDILVQTWERIEIRNRYILLNKRVKE